MKVPVDSHFNFHYSNAYENEQGLIILGKLFLQSDCMLCYKSNHYRRNKMWENESGSYFFIERAYLDDC